MLYTMENTVQPYDWGSTKAMGELFGFPNPEGRPMAELWMGSHPKAPSRVAPFPARPAADGTKTRGGSIGLDELIAGDPTAVLGRRVAARFGNRLPFLFKVLSAAQGLSIQAHPDLQTAREGFAREEAAGVPIGARERNYRDDNHKPELLCALTEFWALRGFRAPARIAADLAGIAGSSALREPLGLPEETEALRGFLQRLLSLESGTLRQLLGEATSTAAEQESEPRFAWVKRLAAQRPGDVGALAPLYLNLIRLDPGQAIYQEAGVLHAYLEGTGVELMANSDNVLRGGLTGKHVDVPELMRVGRFLAEEPLIIAAESVGEDGDAPAGATADCRRERYPAPFAEFELQRVSPHGKGCELETTTGPLIVLCTEGEIELREDHAHARITPGQSAFLSAGASRVGINGHGIAYLARVPQAAPR